MTTTSTQKAPAAVLADERGEGLNSPTSKKESTTMLPKSAAIPTRIALDENTTVDVEPVENHVELTVTSNNRTTFGLALDPSEARRVAEALLDSSAPQFGAADAHDIDEHVRVARKAHKVMSPAKYAQLLREAQG